MKKQEALKEIASIKAEISDIEEKAKTLDPKDRETFFELRIRTDRLMERVAKLEATEIVPD